MKQLCSQIVSDFAISTLGVPIIARSVKWRCGSEKSEVGAKPNYKLA